mmetsp:Transcript_90374/g.292549  ORF Transcript_90374/g.292549 Transcript_90374/m.292549 type:complete len:218 (-) Transcript_90374:240-893(-)
MMMIQGGAARHLAVLLAFVSLAAGAVDAGGCAAEAGGAECTSGAEEAALHSEADTAMLLQMPREEAMDIPAAGGQDDLLQSEVRAHGALPNVSDLENLVNSTQMTPPPGFYPDSMPSNITSNATSDLEDMLNSGPMAPPPDFAPDSVPSNATSNVTSMLDGALMDPPPDFPPDSVLSLATSGLGDLAEFLNSEPMTAPPGFPADSIPPDGHADSDGL